MRFSILVPVYNVAEYLPACIESVLQQTYQNYELVLVDDGSTDRSGEICDEYAAKYEQIRVFHNKNQGPLHTRVFAINQAKGTWIVFLDSDDELKPNALETIYNTANEYNCDCVIYGYEKNKNGKVVETFHPNIENLVFDDKRLLYKRVLSSNYYNALWIKAVKAERIGKWDFSDYYHLQLGEDLLQSLEILWSVKRVVFVPDILYVYRLRQASITNKQDVSMDLIDFTIYEKILLELKEKELFSEEDFIEYRGACIRILLDKIWKIAISSIDTARKKEFFKEIEQSSYYQEFLANGEYRKQDVGNKHFVFRLFSMKLYTLLIILLNIIHSIKNLL